MEEAGGAGEVVEAVEAEGVGALGREGALVPGQEEGRGLAADGGLDLDQPLGAVRRSQRRSSRTRL